MTLGEKIHVLRKKESLSQEQLADQLSVSRQSISKWELNESIPDTDKIIKLSKIFQVSTDFLLLNNIESEKKISPSITKNENSKKLFIIATGMNSIGLIMSIVAQFTWQSIFSISFGLIIQIISFIIFEIMNSHFDTKSGNKIFRKNFYALNIWLILPFPIFLLFNFISSIYPRSHSYLIDVLLMVVTYITFCGIFTFIMKKNKK